MSPGARDLGPEEVPGCDCGLFPSADTSGVWIYVDGLGSYTWREARVLSSGGGWLERPQLFSVLSGCSCLSLQWK